MTIDRQSKRTRDSTFRFEYQPPTITAGRGCVADLESELERRGLERALVVCGSTVGGTPAVMEPIRMGLGNRLAGVFDETTPRKRLSTAAAARDRLGDADADAIVSVGGGSSLDTATVASVLASSDRPAADVADELAETGSITVPDEDLVPILAVPTTLAGAELSMIAGITAAPESGLVDEEVGGSVGGPELMPEATFYDPDVVATTPESVLAGSAMNGFDKGIETIYAHNATPITDATASRGLSLLVDGLSAFGNGERGTDVFETILEGNMLVQYGISRPDELTLSIIHAFGHGLTRTYDVQQGAAHGIVAPHVLEYLFGADGVDARQEVLAAALGAGDAVDPGEAIVEAVADVRDALSLPSRLRDVDGPEPDEFPAVAEAILSDSFMDNAPPGLDPSSDEIEAILERAR